MSSGDSGTNARFKLSTLFSVAAGAALIFLAFHWRVLGEPLLQFSDARNCYVGYRVNVTNALRAWLLPIWNPFVSGGIPYTGGIGVLSLWNLPYFFFDYLTAETLDNVVQFFCLYLAFAYYLRIQGRDLFHSLFFSGFFMLTGPVLFFYGYTPVWNGYITFLLSLIFLEFWDRKNSDRFLVLLFACMVVHFLDMSYGHTIAFAAFLAFQRGYLALIRREWRNTFALPAVVFFLAFLTSAYNWLPLLESILASNRAQYSYLDYLLYTPLQFLEAVLFGKITVGRYYYNPAYIFFGIPLLVLFFQSSLFSGQNSPSKKSMLATLIPVFCFMVPAYVFSLGYDFFRFNFILTLVFCSLAAEQHEALVGCPVFPKKTQAYLAGMGLGILVLLYRLQETYLKIVALALLCLAAILFFSRKADFFARYKKNLVVLAVSSVYIVIYADHYAASGYLRTGFFKYPKVEYQFLTEVERLVRAHSNTPAAPGKIILWPHESREMNPSLFPSVGLKTLIVNNQYLSKDAWEAFIKNGLMVKNSGQSFWEFIGPKSRVVDWDTYSDFGVEWALVPEIILQKFPPGGRQVGKISYSQDAFILLHNEKYLGAAYIVRGDGTREAVDITRREDTRLQVKAEGKAGDLLVFADNDYPGWSAMLNGAEAELLRYRGILKAVRLNSGGAQTLTFDFHSAATDASFGFAALGLGLFFALLWSRRNARSKEFSKNAA